MCSVECCSPLLVFRVNHILCKGVLYLVRPKNYIDPVLVVVVVVLDYNMFEKKIIYNLSRITIVNASRRRYVVLCSTVPGRYLL